MASNLSVEWLGGAKWALRKLKPEVWSQGIKAHSQRDLRWLVDHDYEKVSALLAEAEAREASGAPVLKVTDATWDPAPEVIPGVHAALDALTVRKVPTAAEVIEECRNALETLQSTHKAPTCYCPVGWDAPAASLHSERCKLANAALRKIAAWEAAQK